MGENGAGKCTLMNILYGLERPDRGRILLDGRPSAIRDPLAASRLGIGMVHQHFRLIPAFTVAENVVMGIEPVRRGVFLDPKRPVRRVERWCSEYGFAVDARLQGRRAHRRADAAGGDHQDPAAPGAHCSSSTSPPPCSRPSRCSSLFTTLRN